MTFNDALADQLLAEAAAAPDDDTVRLVLADRLDELGRPGAAARAELIRAQVELARTPAAVRELVAALPDHRFAAPEYVRVVELGARVQELIDAYREAWLCVPCTACALNRSAYPPDLDCPVCRDTGDAGLLTTYIADHDGNGTPDIRAAYEVTYERGFEAEIGPVRVSDLYAEPVCPECGGPGVQESFDAAPGDYAYHPCRGCQFPDSEYRCGAGSHMWARPTPLMQLWLDTFPLLASVRPQLGPVWGLDCAMYAFPPGLMERWLELRPEGAAWRPSEDQQLLGRVMVDYGRERPWEQTKGGRL